MTYTHISQTERYQIQALMKAGQTQTEIAQILGRHQSTISRELARGSGRQGYRPRQAQNLSDKRSQSSRNAAHVDERILIQMRSLLSLQWSPEQIASQLPISHETIYQQVYADKAMGGHLWRSIAEPPESIERHTYIGHWEGDTVIGAAHQHAIVTLVK